MYEERTEADSRSSILLSYFTNADLKLYGRSSDDDERVVLILMIKNANEPA